MSALGERLAREASIAAGLAAASASSAAVASLAAPLAMGFCALAAAALLTAASIGFLTPELGWPRAVLSLGLFWGALAVIIALVRLARRGPSAFPDPQAAARRAAEAAHLAATQQYGAGHAAPPPYGAGPRGPARGNAPLSDLELAEMAIRAFRDAAVAGRAMRGGPRRRRDPYL